MRTAKRYVWVGLLLLGTLNCGSDDGKKSPSAADGSASQPTSFDNYTACKNWVASLKCGSFDPSTVVPCDSYKQVTTCDISAYFDCLTSNFKCSSGIPDPSGWSQCTSKATCK